MVSSINGFTGPIPTPKPLTASEKIAAKRAADAAAIEAAFDRSPVQRMLDNQKTQASKKVNYEETEDFLRLKAFEIRKRIVLYQNLGMNAEYQQAQAEGVAVVQKYQALLASGKIKSTSTTV